MKRIRSASDIRLIDEPKACTSSFLKSFRCAPNAETRTLRSAFCVLCCELFTP